MIRREDARDGMKREWEEQRQDAVWRQQLRRDGRSCLPYSKNATVVNRIKVLWGSGRVPFNDRTFRSVESEISVKTDLRRCEIYVLAVVRG